MCFPAAGTYYLPPLFRTLPHCNTHHPPPLSTDGARVLQRLVHHPTNPPPTHTHRRSTCSPATGASWSWQQRSRRASTSCCSSRCVRVCARACPSFVGGMGERGSVHLCVSVSTSGRCLMGRGDCCVCIMGIVHGPSTTFLGTPFITPPRSPLLSPPRRAATGGTRPARSGSSPPTASSAVSDHHSVR